MITITIRGVTAAMIFDMESWEAIEETLGICYPEGLAELLRKPKDRLRTIRTIADLMSLEGERLGKGHHMPEDWLKENITPRQTKASNWRPNRKTARAAGRLTLPCLKSKKKKNRTLDAAHGHVLWFDRRDQLHRIAEHEPGRIVRLLHPAPGL